MSVGEKSERTCAKHFPETWFVDTHVGRQNAGGSLETPLSFDLLHDRRRDIMAEKDESVAIRLCLTLKNVSPL
jgi:hypothetical protein